LKALNLRTVLVGAFAAASLALAGCGGGFSCSDKGSCSNDVAPTQTEIDACNAALNDSKCGSKFKDAAQCGKDNATCNADGVSDVGSKCDTQTAAYVSCLSGS
jgi:hypothetical protein